MEHLFSEFSPASAADWKTRLEKDLKGITFEQLCVQDRNDITIHPFYTEEDQPNKPAPVRRQSDWAICEQIVVNDAETANYKALAALNNGASGLCFVLNEDGIDPAILLKDIQLPYIYVYFQVELVSQDFYEQLEAFILSNNWDITTLHCYLNAEFRMPEGAAESTADTAKLMMRLPLLNQLSIDGRLYHNAGANSITELGILLSKLNANVGNLSLLDKLDTLQKIHISVATGTHFFEQIAKLRALRKLVSLLCKEYGLKTTLHIHAEAGRLYRSAFDSYSNLLRDTIAGMAAVTGGCDSLYIPAFDEPSDPENDFSKRMSRNQQLIFKEESYLNKVADIAAGSFYIETLTEQIATKAWEQFKAIEKEGGFIAAYDNGYLKTMVGAQAKQLIQDYKDGKKVLIGVNKFPNPEDMPEAIPEEPHAYDGYNGVLPVYLFREIL